MKALYKYPQGEFPYSQLVEENRRRSRTDFEYELLDTDVFNEDRYFDVATEYAKAGAECILIKITVTKQRSKRSRPVRSSYRMVPQHMGVGQRRLSPRFARSRPAQHS